MRISIPIEVCEFLFANDWSFRAEHHGSIGDRRPRVREENPGAGFDAL